MMSNLREDVTIDEELIPGPKLSGKQKVETKSNR